MSMKKHQQGYFHVSDRDLWTVVLAVVVVVGFFGWAFIEGTIWAIHNISISLSSGKD